MGGGCILGGWKDRSRNKSIQKCWFPTLIKNKKMSTCVKEFEKLVKCEDKIRSVVTCETDKRELNRCLLVNFRRVRMEMIYTHRKDSRYSWV